jgi:hypothetical protein
MQAKTPNTLPISRDATHHGFAFSNGSVTVPRGNLPRMASDFQNLSPVARPLASFCNMPWFRFFKSLRCRTAATSREWLRIFKTPSRRSLAPGHATLRS